ncbi:MAG: magnesium chelatase, partial [Wujia sp.]
REEEMLKNAFEHLNLSARGTHRILKLARTIADLNHKSNISSTHLQEAIFFRNNGSGKGESI